NVWPVWVVFGRCSLPSSVMPAKAGISLLRRCEIPAFAGMTDNEGQQRPMTVVQSKRRPALSHRRPDLRLAEEGDAALHFQRAVRIAADLAGVALAAFGVVDRALPERAGIIEAAQQRQPRQRPGPERGIGIFNIGL